MIICDICGKEIKDKDWNYFGDKMSCKVCKKELNKIAIEINNKYRELQIKEENEAIEKYLKKIK